MWIVLIVAAVGVAAWWFELRIRRPLHRLGTLVRALSEGRSPEGYVAYGGCGIDGVIRDLETVDARIRHLEYHVSSEKFNLQAILTSMVEGVLVVGEDRRIKLANGELVAMFGLQESPVERTAMEALRNDEIQRVIDLTIRENRQVSREIYLERVRNGAPITVCFQVNAVPLLDKRRVPSGVVMVFHDITRIKNLEVVRSEFVSNVSHELRTPLSIFKGYLETLIDHPEWLSPDARPILGVLERHSDRLNSLVNDLLTLSRLESGRIPLHQTDIDAADFFSQILSDWQKPFAAKSCTLRITGADPGRSFHADRLRIEQVFYNLLENALKYSHEGGVVSVFMERAADGNGTEFRVSDNGVGIDPAKVPQVFDRFFRADPSRARELGGTGLGLSIVKQIVQLHGGRVWAESEPDRGTTIGFTLPLRPPGSAG
jgi:two-component system phosphate regulon sensor histidine kinase PhoR